MVFSGYMPSSWHPHRGLRYLLTKQNPAPQGMADSRPGAGSVHHEPGASYHVTKWGEMFLENVGTKTQESA